MPPTLETPDGKSVTVDPEAVDREFSRAMASEPGPAEQAPPKRTAETPEDRAAARGTAREAKAKRAPKEERARTTAAAATVLDDGQRAQGVKGIAQVGAAIALMFGKATGKDAFKADAVTIASAAPEIADAAIQVAHADPKFAAALDKVCSAGPYAAMISVVVSVGSQCARNHKPDLKIPGTVDPAELLKAQNEAEMANAG